MNWKWHYHLIVNVFFFIWFGFYSAQNFRAGNLIGFVFWALATFGVSYWMVGDWQKNWREDENVADRTI